MRINIVLNAGSKQCCANTGPERSCAKTNNITRCYTNKGSNSNLNNRPDDALMLVANNNEITEIGKKASTEITNHLQKEFDDVFAGIVCIDWTFSLQVKPDSKPYQVPPWCIAYVFQVTHYVACQLYFCSLPKERRGQTCYKHKIITLKIELKVKAQKIKTTSFATHFSYKK